MSLSLFQNVLPLETVLNKNCLKQSKPKQVLSNYWNYIWYFTQPHFSPHFICLHKFFNPYINQFQLLEMCYWGNIVLLSCHYHGCLQNLEEDSTGKGIIFCILGDYPILSDSFQGSDEELSQTLKINTKQKNFKFYNLLEV